MAEVEARAPQPAPYTKGVSLCSWYPGDGRAGRGRLVDRSPRRICVGVEPSLHEYCAVGLLPHMHLEPYAAMVHSPNIAFAGLLQSTYRRPAIRTPAMSVSPLCQPTLGSLRLAPRHRACHPARGHGRLLRLRGGRGAARAAGPPAGGVSQQQQQGDRGGVVSKLPGERNSARWVCVRVMRALYYRLQRMTTTQLLLQSPLVPNLLLPHAQAVQLSGCTCNEPLCYYGAACLSLYLPFAARRPAPQVYGPTCSSLRPSGAAPTSSWCRTSLTSTRPSQSRCGRLRPLPACVHHTVLYAPRRQVLYSSHALVSQS